jgi:hypothetical protein
VFNKAYFILSILLICSCTSSKEQPSYGISEHTIEHNKKLYLIEDNKIQSKIFISETRAKNILKGTISTISFGNRDLELTLEDFEAAVTTFMVSNKKPNCFVREVTYINKTSIGKRGYNFYYSCP